MNIEIKGVIGCISESSWAGICLFLLILLAVLSFTTGRKWILIRKAEKRIQKLEAELIEKEELLKILNIQLN